MKDSTRGFWIGFVVGVGCTLVGIVLLAVVILTFYTGPQLAVEIDVPSSAIVGEPMTITIAANNPHAEDVTLGNVDIPDRFFDSFEMELVWPTASEDSPIGGFGTKTWYYDTAVPPGETMTIELTVLPRTTGTHLVELDVCNSFEDCSSITRAVEVGSRQ